MARATLNELVGQVVYIGKKSMLARATLNEVVGQVVACRLPVAHPWIIYIVLGF